MVTLVITLNINGLLGWRYLSNFSEPGTRDEWILLFIRHDSVFENGTIREKKKSQLRRNICKTYCQWKNFSSEWINNVCMSIRNIHTSQRKNRKIEETQIANKNKERCSFALLMGEMQIKLCWNTDWLKSKCLISMRGHGRMRHHCWGK